MKVIHITEIRKTAERFFEDRDYYCSEAVMKSIRDGFGVAVPDEVIAMASGFPAGLGGSGCLCGAVAGGVMALGLFFGRSGPRDRKVKKAMALSRELQQMFVGRHKSTCCRVLTRGMRHGSELHMQQCTALTGEVAEETARIIVRELPDHYRLADGSGADTAPETPRRSAVRRLAAAYRRFVLPGSR